MPERLKGSTEIRSDFKTIIFRDYTKLLNYVALNIKNKKNLSSQENLREHSGSLGKPTLIGNST